ncbi:MAG: hypothetical protein KAR42_14730 [candidate division Zixibacteria bacterium]|nr:hypothetical protein [candidate division Zixibacteria bacterium]
MAKTKAVPGNKRTQKSVQKRYDGDLMQIKVWVAGKKSDPEGIEADKTRRYAAKQPVTKVLLAAL